jgi:sialic acid synthase SpsE
MTDNRRLTIDGVEIQLIDAAHQRGVDAVKFQRRDNRTLYAREF